jgi:polyhydroxyalkanoate synthesis regulator phasin
MFESLRKLMYMGLGAAAMSHDKAKQAIDEMVSRGEVSTEEGRKLYEEWASRAEDEGRSLNDRIKTQIRQYLSDAGVADRNQVEMLSRRIDALENRIDELVAVTESGKPVFTHGSASTVKKESGMEPDQEQPT